MAPIKYATEPGPRSIVLRVPEELLLELDRSASVRGISRNRLILEHLLMGERIRRWVISGLSD